MSGNVKISQLPVLSTMTDVTIVPVVATGNTFQIDGLSIKDYVTGGLANVAFSGEYTDIANTPNALSDFSNDVGYITNSVTGNFSATGNVTANYLLGNGSQLTNVNSSTFNVTDTNGLSTVYYPTFVENRTTNQIARADVDLSYRTDTNTLTTGNIALSGNITGNTAGFALGYRDIPQVSLTGNTTITTADAGKHYYANSVSTFTWTIANNASQAFALGATINLINKGTGNVNILQGSGVSLYLAGNAVTGNRVLTSYGVASITKVESDTWFIAGVGLV